MGQGEGCEQCGSRLGELFWVFEIGEICHYWEILKLILHLYMSLLVTDDSDDDDSDDASVNEHKHDI